MFVILFLISVAAALYTGWYVEFGLLAILTILGHFWFPVEPDPLHDFIRRQEQDQ